MAAHHRPELIGLAFIAVGVFLAAVLWFGLSGGPVTHLVRRAVGDAAYLAPVIFIPVGVLVVARSALVALSPFRLGLTACLLGLMLTLGRGHGGAVGRGAEWVVALGLGTTGATILGVLLAIAGVLFLTGVSLGAILRRSGHAVRAAHGRVRATRDAALYEVESSEIPVLRHASPAVDLQHDFSDLVSDSLPAVLFQAEPEEFEEADSEDPTEETLFAPLEASDTEYTLPDPGLLHVSKPGSGGPNAEAGARVAQALVTCLSNFGVDATVIGQISGPRVTRYELQLAPGTKVAKVAQLKTT
jgi:DNA segregation ATPase FtsK/SpoIIIE-like protein